MSDATSTPAEELSIEEVAAEDSRGGVEESIDERVISDRGLIFRGE